MRVYLAAAWGRREEVLAISKRLEAVGVEITSRWLIEEAGMQTGAFEKFLRERAYIDVADVDRADAIVRFTDPESQEDFSHVPKALLSGARMFETGYAYARGKTIYVVGGKQNVFDRLGNIIHVKDVDALVKVLSQEGE